MKLVLIAILSAQIAHVMSDENPPVADLQYELSPFSTPNPDDEFIATLPGMRLLKGIINRVGLHSRSVNSIPLSRMAQGESSAENTYLKGAVTASYALNLLKLVILDNPEVKELISAIINLFGSDIGLVDKFRTIFSTVKSSSVFTQPWSRLITPMVVLGRMLHLNSPELTSKFLAFSSELLRQSYKAFWPLQTTLMRVSTKIIADFIRTKTISDDSIDALDEVKQAYKNYVMRSVQFI